MNTQSPSVAVALDRLREQLDYHRSIGKRAVFPDELKRKVAGLSKDYPASTLLETLAISSSSLDRWKKQFLDHNTNTATDRDNSTAINGRTFVALPARDISERYPLTVSLGCANSASQVTLQGEVTLSQWRELVLLCSETLQP